MSVDWEPPEGMESIRVKAWKAFYAQAITLYGVTPSDNRLMYVAQKGRCWICREAKGVHPDDPKARGARRLGIDHNHTTGAVRGLLCTGGPNTCNRIIGWLKDNPKAFQRAADYLVMPPARVLGAVREALISAEAQGATLSRVEIDGLAVSYLWPADV
jgi:hypothetical protein